MFPNVKASQEKFWVLKLRGFLLLRPSKIKFCFKTWHLFCCCYTSPPQRAPVPQNLTVKPFNSSGTFFREFELKTLFPHQQTMTFLCFSPFRKPCFLPPAHLFLYFKSYSMCWTILLVVSMLLNGCRSELRSSPEMNDGALLAGLNFSRLPVSPRAGCWRRATQRAPRSRNRG